MALRLSIKQVLRSINPRVVHMDASSFRKPFLLNSRASPPGRPYAAITAKNVPLPNSSVSLCTICTRFDRSTCLNSARCCVQTLPCACNLQTNCSFGRSVEPILPIFVPFLSPTNSSSTVQYHLSFPSLHRRQRPNTLHHAGPCDVMCWALEGEGSGGVTG